jgi:flagellar hook-associated protein 2
VQSFITAYNTLLGVFDTLTAAGDHTDLEHRQHAGRKMRRSTTTPACATCATASPALRSATGGQSLINFGISAAKDGTLTLDTNRLNAPSPPIRARSTPCSAAPASASTAACWVR